LSLRFQAQTSAAIQLLRRSLIEKEGERFFLQPVVLEYVTDQFVQRLEKLLPKARATQNPCLIKAGQRLCPRDAEAVDCRADR